MEFIGQSTVRALEKGAVQEYLNLGYPIQQAIAKAIADGRMKHENTVKNIIVSAGKQLVLGR